MTLSRNELEALAKKAARGAGMSWGLAEEAAKATRWLCEQDLDGCAALAGVLTARDGTKAASWTPIAGRTWTAQGTRLCPIASGAALSDHAEMLTQTTELRIENVVHPVLMAPFAHLIARHLKTTVTLRWDDTVATTDGQHLSITGDSAATQTGRLTVTTGGPMGLPRPRRSRAAPHPESVATLTRLAQRTYAPATEMSRLKGAGAGLSDND